MDPVTHTVFVANSGDNTVSVIDESTNSVTATIGVGGSPEGVGVVASTGTTYSAPSIFVRAGGEADIVAEGPGNTLQYSWATPGKPWNHFQVAGPGTTYSG